MGYLGKKIKNAREAVAEGQQTEWMKSASGNSTNKCKVCNKRYDKMSYTELNAHYQHAKKGKKGCPNLDD